MSDQQTKNSADVGRSELSGLVRLLFIAGEVSIGRNGFCPQCGLVSTDEDGMCILCGATAQGEALRELANDILGLQPND